MSVRQKVSRRNVLTAKCPYGEVSLRQSVLTAKCPYGKMSVRRNVRTAKSPYGEMSYDGKPYGENSYGEKVRHRSQHTGKEPPCSLVM